MATPVLSDVRDGVAHVVLNRPDVANAFDLDTARAFASAVDQIPADDAVRAVLVTGAGPRFCAGGDVSSFAGAADQPSYLHTLASEMDAAFQQLAALEKPVVAAVHGAVAGAGLALMLSCDLVVAHVDTRFAFAYPAIGLTPDCGLSHLLPRAVGQQRALQFALMGKPVSATDASLWGLVTEVSDDPGSRGLELARRLADGPARAWGQCRRLLRSSWEMSRGETGAEEARTITEMVRGREAQDLIDRFTRR